MSTGETLEARIEVALRVIGVDLSFADVSRQLELEALPRHRKERMARHHSTGARERVWSHSFSGIGLQDLGGSLSGLLGFLEGKRPAIEALQNEGHRVDLFVGIFSDDASYHTQIDSRVLSRIGSLGLSLHLDVYFTGF